MGFVSTMYASSISHHRGSRTRTSARMMMMAQPPAIDRRRRWMRVTRVHTRHTRRDARGHIYTYISHAYTTRIATLASHRHRSIDERSDPIHDAISHRHRRRQSIIHSSIRCHTHHTYREQAQRFASTRRIGGARVHRRLRGARRSLRAARLERRARVQLGGEAGGQGHGGRHHECGYDALGESRDRPVVDEIATHTHTHPHSTWS